MNLKTITALVSAAIVLEIFRYVTLNFIIEEWWEIEGLSYLSQGIYLFFLISLATFFIYLNINQKENNNE